MPNFEEHHQLIREAHIQVKTDLNEVDQVMQWFEQFNQPPLPCDLWMQGKLAIMEGLTNVIRHAHKSLPVSTPIDLTVKLFSNQLDISIWDEGCPFDFEALLESVDRQFSHPLEREAHWGGVLMRKLREKHHWTINYRCPADLATHRNCLSIQKAFS
ncbi:ATP-binding protein [Phormidesmis sp. 146-12]